MLRRRKGKNDKGVTYFQDLIKNFIVQSTISKVFSVAHFFLSRTNFSLLINITRKSHTIGKHFNLSVVITTVLHTITIDRCYPKNSLEQQFCVNLKHWKPRIIISERMLIMDFSLHNHSCSTRNVEDINLWLDIINLTNTIEIKM